MVRHLVGQEGQTGVAARKYENARLVTDFPLFARFGEGLPIRNSERIERPPKVKDGPVRLEARDSLDRFLRLG